MFAGTSTFHRDSHLHHALLFYYALDGADGVEERGFNGTLEFEETVLWGPFAFGLAVEIRGVHEFVVEELDSGERGRIKIRIKGGGTGRGETYG